jgi:hypothetical protein
MNAQKLDEAARSAFLRSDDDDLRRPLPTSEADVLNKGEKVFFSKHVHQLFRR